MKQLFLKRARTRSWHQKRRLRKQSTTSWAKILTRSSWIEMIWITLLRSTMKSRRKGLEESDQKSNMSKLRNRNRDHKKLRISWNRRRRFITSCPRSLIRACRRRSRRRIWLIRKIRRKRFYTFSITTIKRGNCSESIIHPISV